ncbi:(2Fe-2S)-binding protein [Streptomyces sp. WAC 06738]|uniref:(2Fe-2S)-binding protein n=1 Tax=Streptomyces sp. WAC 06738 TaxID=2203210 RepID=UPI000F713B8E|nr:(2Fe-2S)-binding protein [Streptomyces sp. WAC 06738]AZM45585.1 (2Fe-2S)-binding protein [Streptomyces sp. WAC 06738]
MFVCSCFGITEEQVRAHASAGRCTPRQIASECKAGTDCGSCVRRIQALLGRGADCARRELLEGRQPAGEGAVPVAAGSQALAGSQVTSENAVAADAPATVDAALLREAA